MQRTIITLLSLLLFSFVHSQSTSFAVSAIPESLTQNAYGVVRFSTTEFEYKNEKLGTEKINVAITVLDVKGKDLSDFVCSTDKFCELKKFSGKLYNAQGVLLRKFKLSDLSSTEYSSSLATDARYYFMSCSSPVYPYTIHYEYEIEWKKGIFLFPSFFPQDNYNLSVEKADYVLKVPENVNLRRKVMNMQDTPEVSNEKASVTYHWQVNNLSAIEDESFSPTLKQQVPRLLLSPEKFSYDGINGIITDWTSYGMWMAGLQKDRNILPEALKTKILELISSASSDIEKVKILYDYLGETTRYVSIQLGIGGYQPMPAAEVYKTGFGDCKALTFYLKSMLEFINIPANYVGIRLDNKNKTLMHDYPSFQEINHVILQVPLADDTLWLECTNTKNPFGFVHNGIAGHDALIISENNSSLCKLPDYADSLNVEKNTAKVVLDADGKGNVSSTKEYHVKVYDRHSYFTTLKKDEQTDKLRNGIDLPNAYVGKIETVENKSSQPSLLINYDWHTTGYGSKTGNRLFVPVNPFRFQYKWFKKNNRKNDISIYTGFYDIDNIDIAIPEGYEIESIPLSEVIETPFGHFYSAVIHNERNIHIVQKFLLKTGEYSIADYKDIRAFFDKINTAYNQKIILRKKV